MPANHREQPVVVFDGSCGFCSRFVAFVLRHEKSSDLLFSPNSSPFGAELLGQHNLVQDGRNTIVVVHGDYVLLRSDAVIFIARYLSAPYSWAQSLKVLPKFIRDTGYRFVAAIRAFLPGDTDVCALLPPGLQERIINRRE